MRNSFYTVRTRAGITFTIEASSDQQAWQRANSPELGNNIANLMREAVSHVTSVEFHRGPTHLLKTPVFGKEIFKN